MSDFSNSSLSVSISHPKNILHLFLNLKLKQRCTIMFYCFKFSILLFYKGKPKCIIV